MSANKPLGTTKTTSLDYSTFTTPLDPYLQKNKLRVFRNKQLASYIVRFVCGGVFGQSGYNPASFQKLYEDYVHYGQEQSGHLQQVSQHDINIPPTYFVAGTNNFGYLCLYSLTKKVQGQNLESYWHIPQNNQEQLANAYNHLVVSLCNYYRSQFNSNSKVMDDIASLRQYKITNNPGGPIIYLIDTDISISNPCPGLAKATLRQLRNTTEALASKFTEQSNQMQPSYLAIDNLKKIIS